ncbi:uncharacterized protein EI90DRAFT_1999218 [Cantharellus anzutake]|uniref:uncharacterized protein n=1 Tax=Cantharellus anzutake TaxID=1750568 RepID=UPI001905BF12|nr:uncharacterized protein EI90DRAFT_1999218 [Cantharellus anzutake]KAF8326122.1 hypothetical protein EI90DRAFT_1999218 [Cantharellus anzutake]
MHNNIVHVTLYVALFFKQIWSQGSPLSEDAASVEIHGTPPFSSSLPLQRTNGLLFLSSASVPTSWSSLHTRVMATSTAALIPSKTFSYLSDSSSIVTGSHHDPVPLKTVPNQSDSFLSIPSESKTASPTYPSPDTAAAIPTTQTHQYPAPSLLAISLLAPSYSNYHPSATSNSASVLQTNTDASTSENISTSPSRNTGLENSPLTKITGRSMATPEVRTKKNTYHTPSVILSPLMMITTRMPLRIRRSLKRENRLSLSLIKFQKQLPTETSTIRHIQGHS